jgi:predicted Holliday junction resolvase-like endonuclease
MIVSEIKLFEMLKAKLGQQEAEAFVEILENKVDRKFDEAKQTLATKEDLAKVEGRLETKLAETKSEIIKWMFIFWMGQVAVIAGLLAYFLNVAK